MSLSQIFVPLPKKLYNKIDHQRYPSKTYRVTPDALRNAFSGVARSIRSKVIHLNAQPFIENCIIQGYSSFHIIFRHILPNLYDILMAKFLLSINSCIMMESTLSFLGFGDLYHPTWGTMINFAYKAFIRGAYNYLLSPGICIVLLSLAFYLISLYFEQRMKLISGR